MPQFSYVAKDSSGKTFKNVTDAYSQTSLVDTLQKQGLFVVNVQEIRVSAPSGKTSTTTKKKKMKFGHKKVKLNDMLIFARQLGTMMEAGVSLIRSLDVIKAQTDSELLYHVILKLRQDVEGGSALSIALAKHPKVFNQFWISLIEVGEASGTIPNVLKKLAFYLEQQAAFRSTIISGLIYPAILFFVSMGAVMFFALVVGPKFEDIFKQMGAHLPLITVVLLSVFRFIKEKIVFLAVGVALFIFLVKNFFKTYQGRILFEKIMFNMPVFGEVYRLIIVERFCSQMAILIDSGVPILYALDICSRLVDNNTCSVIINNIKDSVKEGEWLVTPMERSQFFPPLAVQMINVGEETGELSKMFNHVSAFFQENVTTFMKRFSTIIEPFMLVFMGAVIGTIVLAMFLPMFNIAQLGGAGGG